jgi:pyruvate-formate lyase-activating enzyme
MDVKDTRDYLAEAASVSNLGSFMVFGGEPMLYSERAIAIFEKANQLKIPEIEMITNGIWGNDVRKAEKLAKKLKAPALTPWQ